MPALADKVLETSTTTGTGNVTVAGAVTGWRTLASAYSVGDIINYSIDAVDANGNLTGETEAGIGTILTATTFSRDTVETSSNANNFVSFAAGTKYVYVTQTSININTFGQAYAQQLGYAPV